MIWGGIFYGVLSMWISTEYLKTVGNTFVTISKDTH